jgi:hypothetical protein
MDLYDGHIIKISKAITINDGAIIFARATMLVMWKEFY